MQLRFKYFTPFIWEDIAEDLREYFMEYHHFPMYYEGFHKQAGLTTSALSSYWKGTKYFLVDSYIYTDRIIIKGWITDLVGNDDPVYTQHTYPIKIGR